MSRTLLLTLSKKPFQVMVTGEKTIEYRKPSKWILSRLKGKDYDYVKFVNGYGNDKPYFVAEYKGWTQNTLPYNLSYSNGLNVVTESGDLFIYLGKVIEKGNLKN